MKLQLPLTTEWFEMTKTVKTEDYREITSYFINALFTDDECEPLSKKWIETEFLEGGEVQDYHIEEIKEGNHFKAKPFTTNTMTLGYPKKGDPERTLIFEHAGIEIGYGNPEWGAPIDRMVFIIKHGKRIEL